jgi:hypothetical protein
VATGAACDRTGCIKIDTHVHYARDVVVALGDLLDEQSWKPSRSGQLMDSVGDAYRAIWSPLASSSSSPRVEEATPAAGVFRKGLWTARAGL